MRSKKNSKKDHPGSTGNKRSNRQDNRSGGQNRRSQSGRGQGSQHGGTNTGA